MKNSADLGGCYPHPPRSADFFISYENWIQLHVITKYNRNLTETGINDSKAYQVCQEIILAFGKSFNDHCHHDGE